MEKFSKEHIPSNKEKSEKEAYKKAVAKFNHLKNLIDSRMINYFSSREKGVTELSFNYLEHQKDVHMIRYSKEYKQENNKRTNLFANLKLDFNNKEFRYNSWESLLDSNGVITGKVLKEFPGTKNVDQDDGVIIGPEKAIKIMDRMIKEIEAAKKCVPIINNTNLFLSELKQDIGKVEAKAA